MSRRIAFLVGLGVLLGFMRAGKADNHINKIEDQAMASTIKSESIFYPADLVKHLRDNCAQEDWAGQLAATIIAQAQPWVQMSDEKLWSLMFGATLPRSWMVWSNGHCPACKESVPMYNWEINALDYPWKTRCPHCREFFPKNDFYAFYRSGLDEKGIFSPDKADRSLLFNAEHPDPADPLHRFGVDDGNGYTEGDKRWRFIGAYLIYGQWKQTVLGGIVSLAQAYLVTGDPIYAHKAGIMLDRVADVYPTFDFKTQAVVYETVLCVGYISNWHDACEETRELAMAYDMVFAGMKTDAELTTFLSEKARQFGLANPKESFTDIQHNIEDRILRDALANPHKIHSNYPRQDIAMLVIQAVLNQPREKWYPQLDAMLEKASAVDGVTGEKGLANYSAYVIQGLADYLAMCDRAIPGFLERCLQVHPRLHAMYRFHIDTWCLQQYYPLVGDTGWFANRIDLYQGMEFHHPAAEVDSGIWHGRSALSEKPLGPSMYGFLWNLYRLIGDEAFVQIMYLANDNTVEALPHDLFAQDAAAMQEHVRQVIAEHGTEIKLASVNKQQWCLGILRTGDVDPGGAVWLHYQAGGAHAHQDAMNLGMFAYGMDLMPEFGYPPVQFGGWGSPKALWYTASAAHNTVVVDGENHGQCIGKTTLWADGQKCRAIRASAPEAIPLSAAIPKKQPLADSWKFMWDPDKQGHAWNWHGQSFDDGAWYEIEPVSAWQLQEVGKQWKQQHGSDYNGIAWYRSQFDVNPETPGASVKILFGAVDAACTIWVNGKKLLDRPYPYQGNSDSWDRSFVVDISDVVFFDRPNTVAVRVDNVAGHGGIKRGVWLFDQGTGGSQFERTIVQADMENTSGFYVVDIFRVAGGRDHTLFLHSHFGQVQTSGLALTPGENYGHNTQMRHFRWDKAAPRGWHVDWRIEDRYGYLPAEKEIHLRYTSLTNDTQAALAEGWISYGDFGNAMLDDVWIPRLLIRRQTKDDVLASTFVGVLEPYNNESSIEHIERLPLVDKDGQSCPDGAAAVQIIHRDGTQDLIIAADADDGPPSDSAGFNQVLSQPDWHVTLAGELCLVRKNKAGTLLYIWAAHTRSVQIDDRRFENADPTVLLEWKGN